MSRLEDIEDRVKGLSPEELSAFREWFLDYDGEIWDRQLEADAKNGKLDALADAGLRDHTAGRSSKI